MARQTRNPPQPKTGSPGDPALVTPGDNRPDVLLALQHAAAVTALHQECAAIRQEMGSLTTEIATLKTEKSTLQDDVSELKHLRSRINGGLAVLGIVTAGVIALLWFFVGPTWSTLQTMAAEYQVHKADKEALLGNQAAAAQLTPPKPAASPAAPTPTP